MRLRSELLTMQIELPSLSRLRHYQQKHFSEEKYCRNCLRHQLRIIKIKYADSLHKQKMQNIFFYQSNRLSSSALEFLLSDADVPDVQ